MRMVNPLQATPPVLYTDLRHLVYETAETFGDKPLYDYLEGGEAKTITYRGFADMVEALGTAFEARGLVGGRIAVIGETHPAYLATYIAVVATGGSAVYGEKAMKKLSENGVIIYLKVELPELIRRLGDITTRGIAMDKNSGIPELFIERSPLYEKYAHITVDCTDRTPEECVNIIADTLKEVHFYD